MLNPISSFRNNKKVILVKNEVNSVVHTSVVGVKFLGFKPQVRFKPNPQKTKVRLEPDCFSINV